MIRSILLSRRRRILAGVMLCTALTGCTLLFPLEDLTDSNSDGGAPGSRTDASDVGALEAGGADAGSGTADASPDASQGVTPDGAPADDGNAPAETGAVDAGGADAGFRCSSLSPQPTLCDDFDENPLTFGWSTAITLSGGAAALSDAGWVSPPNSFLATAPADPSGAPAAWLQQVLSFPQQSMTLSFDVRVESADSATGCVADIGLGGGDVRILLVNGTNALQQNLSDGGIVYTPMNVSVPFNAWTHVEYTLTVGPPVHASVLINGASAISEALDPGYGSGTVYLNVGLLYVTAPSTSWTVRYDDVVFNMQ